jgi:hypothetical protein
MKGDKRRKKSKKPGKSEDLYNICSQGRRNDVGKRRYLKRSILGRKS